MRFQNECGGCRRGVGMANAEASGGHWRLRWGQSGFSQPDLILVLGVITVLAGVIFGWVGRTAENRRMQQCVANLGQVNRAVLQYTEENRGQFPTMEDRPAPGGWWYYKEDVKGYLGLKGESSAADTVFGCPSDRGYVGANEVGKPFRLSAKHRFTSYVFNGVDLPGVPSLAGKKVEQVRTPDRTLMVMEWTAHGPLSWHRSRTGSENSPFYDGAESVVGYVDGHVGLTRIYYDGLNPAYTRDPIAGYAYRYGAD